MSDLSEIIIEDGITEINENTIENHKNITSVKIPDSVLVIADKAFANCINLKEIKLPAGIMHIGKAAFSNCISLESIEIPEGIKSIEESCFEGCESLESISLPETVTIIKDKAFAGCTGIKNLILPDNLTSCTSNAFPNCQKYLPVNKVYRYENEMMVNTYNKMLLFFNGKRKKVVTPKDVRGIAFRAFYGTEAELIRITDNITSISDEVFINAKNPVEIIIPDSVDYIEISAFDENTTILCPKGSYAEHWCRNGKFTQLEDKRI